MTENSTPTDSLSGVSEAEITYRMKPYKINTYDIVVPQGDRSYVAEQLEQEARVALQIADILSK